MVTFQLNYGVIFVASVIGMIIGSLWYSPLLFGNLWIRLSGFNSQDIENSKQKGMAKTYALMFFGLLLMNWILAHILYSARIFSLFGGAHIGAGVCLGFVVPVLMGGVLWEGKSWKLYFLNVGYYFVSLVIMGALIAYWR